MEENIVSTEEMPVHPKVQSDNQLSVYRGKYTVDETIQRIKDKLRALHITVYTVIDHAANALDTNQYLPPTKVIFFGTDKISYDLIRENRHIAMDLPLKIMAWEDDLGDVWVGYVPMLTIALRYHMERHLEIGGMDALLDDIVISAAHGER